MFPQLVFSLVNVLSGNIVQETPVFEMVEILPRTLLAAAWIWLHLLIEVISNQRLSASIIEDRSNKPWRPLPSGRISPDAARRLLFFAVPCAVLASVFLNVLTPSLTLIALSWLYNDAGGADEHFLVRNILNAAGLLTFGAGATFVISGPAVTERQLNQTGCEWFSIIAVVIVTTVHVQDLPDMEGDAARNRGTLPLRWGEKVARYSAASLILWWSLACPAYWGSKFAGCIAPFTLGTGLAILVVGWDSVSSSRLAWRLWCFWMMVLFTLPLTAI